MAEQDLSQPYIGYRSAGRRPEQYNDRTASANAPLSALRGYLAGTAGLPGDLEGLARSVMAQVPPELLRASPVLSMFGLGSRADQTPTMPTSAFYNEYLPGADLNQTPTGKLFTGAGNLMGGAYSTNLARAGKAGTRYAGEQLNRAILDSSGPLARLVPQAAKPMYAVKPKGGNWLSGSVEDSLKPLKTEPLQMDRYVIRDAMSPEDLGSYFAAAEAPGVTDLPSQLKAAGLYEKYTAPTDPVNNWVDKTLTKYVKNEMATPEDPVRALAERGVLHVNPEQLNFILEKHGKYMQPGQTAVAQSNQAKAWEGASDLSVGSDAAGNLTTTAHLGTNPWLAKVPPETPVYAPSAGHLAPDLGFDHLIDELRNATNPASGLPANLLLKPEALSRVTVPQAVERVAKINAWREAQKVEANQALANNAATQLVKEYPAVPGTQNTNDKGLRWVELKAPEGKPLVEGEYADPLFDIPPDQQERIMNQAHTRAARRGLDEEGDDYRMLVQGYAQELATNWAKRNPPKISKELEAALKYEGDTMGHCVGGYCPDVIEGKSRIYSLRDAKGQPHVTVEVEPGRLSGKNSLDEWKARYAETHGPDAVEPFLAEHPEIAEAFVPSITQIKGKGNRKPNDEYLPFVQDFVRSGNWGQVGDLQNTGLVQLPDKRLLTKEQFDEGIQRMTGEGEPSINAEWFQRQIKNDPSWWENVKDAFEGFSHGGQVRGFANGGHVAYDSDSVDRIVRGFAEGGTVDVDETKAAFGIYPKQQATASSKETKAAAAEAAQFAADMLIPQTAMDAGLMLIPGGKIARKAGAALIALDAGDVEAGPLTKLLKAVKGSIKDPEVLKDAVKEHKMLQGVYRGYVGENVPAKTAFGTETYFVSPQKRVADYYAQRRAAETGTAPHAEMMLVDPATLRHQPYNLSIPVDKYNRDFLVTRARRVDPDEAKSRTQLYAKGGSVTAYDPSRVDAILNEFM